MLPYANARNEVTANQLSSIEALVCELRSQGSRYLTERVIRLYDDLAAPCQERMVVFGAGHLGRFVLPGLIESGVDVISYCDNNTALLGQNIAGIPIVSPTEAIARYGDSAAFLVAIYNATAVKAQLHELGCPRIIPYPVAFGKFSVAFGDQRLALPDKILEHTDAIVVAYALLSDDKSRSEFAAQVRWRCSLDYSCLPNADSNEEIYFPADLVRMSPSEVLADGGAFDGDTIRAFIRKRGGHFKHVYAIEPDARSRAELERYVRSLPQQDASRIDVLPYGLGRSDGRVRFAADGTLASRLELTGSSEVEIRTLDNICAGKHCPTFVKMDIEGAELDAISGAAQTISRCRPVMAICAYHRCSDLWVIPMLLKEMCSDYRIFLRRYAEECWETVYYAIPPERLLAPTGECEEKCNEE